MLENLPDAVGHALRNQRAGLEQVLFNLVGLGHGTAALKLGSLAFADHAPIPERYTADGEGVSPPLEWTAPPPGTKALALIVEDPDAPGAEPFIHWLGWGMEPRAGKLFEGEEPPVMGQNSYLKSEWLAPDPPTGHGKHDYVFQLFALDAPLELAAGSGRGAFLDEADGRVVGAAVLTGTYERR